jgi:hypothetical protein
VGREQNKVTEVNLLSSFTTGTPVLKETTIVGLTFKSKTMKAPAFVATYEKHKK